MEIKTKYNIGDIVKVKTRVTDYKKCPICDGIKTIKYKDHTYCCPECYGKGAIEEKYEKINPWKITNINIRIKRDNRISILYESDFSDWGSNNFARFYEYEIVEED